MEIKNLDKGILKEAIKEILLKEKKLLKEILKELLIEHNVILTSGQKIQAENETSTIPAPFNQFDDIIKALT